MGLPVENEWFVRERVDDQITLFREPHVHPFLRCNIWHVRGRDRDLLIDTGMGIANLAQAAEDLFQKQLSVVLTHAHVDHAGGAFEFDNCHVHQADASKIDSDITPVPLDLSLWPPELLAILEESGPIGDYVIAARPSETFDPDAYQHLPAKSKTIIDEGDVIDLGDRSFEVLHLPGHTAGSIGLWEADTGTLFSGDTVYDDNLIDGLPDTDKGVYRRTLERLLDLPVTVVHGGHDDSFGRDRLREIVSAYLDGRAM